MKKHFNVAFVLLFLSFFSIIIYQLVTKINHKNEIAENIKNIPKFSFYNIDGKLFTNQNLKENTAIIFIYFNTECEYCNEEAKMIYENIKKFENAQIIFVSFEKTELIKKFAQQHQLNHYDNVHFLHDNKVTFAPTFDVNSIPSIILYDKNHQLIEKIKGQTKPEMLTKKLNIK